jgi:hypothetical protein
MRFLKLVGAAIIAANLTACGGGGGVPTASEISTDATLLDNFDTKYDSYSNVATSSAVSGSAAVDSNNILTSLLISGSVEYLADMVVESRTNKLLYNVLETSTASNDEINNLTYVTIKYPGHNLKLGDKLEVTSLHDELNGIKYNELNGSFAIELLTSDPDGNSIDSTSFWYKDYFYVVVNGAATVTGAPSSKAILTVNNKTESIVNGLYTDISTNADGKTKIRIPLRGHGLSSGDKIELAIVTQNINGIPAANLANIFDVYPVDDDNFQIKVSGLATRDGLPNSPLIFNANFVSLKCEGVYDLLRNPINTTPEELTKQGYVVYKSESKNSSKLDNCTPQFSNDITTNQYYKLVDGNYYLVAQLISDGTYSIADSTWSFPSGILESGISNTVIGRMTNYSDISKTSITGYTSFSYKTEADTSSSIFLFILTKNYSNQDVLLSTHTNIYQVDSSGAILIKSTVEYNNNELTKVSIKNFSYPPDYPTDLADRLSTDCADITYLSCVKYYY